MNRLFWARLRHSPAALAGGLILLLILAAALAATLFYPGDPRDMVGPPNLWPGADSAFPLGTDMLGRDMAAALMHGARQSLVIAFGAMLLAVVVGTAIGVVCGFFGGRIDDGLMRFTEIFLTMPTLLFTIALVIILGPSAGSIALALGLTSWPQIARLVRADALRVRQNDYVNAAVTMGMGSARIIVRHVLPNSLSAVIVSASVLVAQVILAEASLSFMGLGDTDTVSWGSMVGAGRQVLRTAWYMTALPGLAIFVTVMAFMLLGNGLNDVLNPRTTR
ncbi:ABC transporter permease [Acidovorax sp. CCYZU-2555]|uniref:ABC transporter permease n=1 Tax=Acidovorax sp. CCYZU-2555 TaxID=2835042 RepID=UPI001BCC143D|nr:ABC transporter permease [Acidovorax sp. CCYZU-2555]MBS7780526.1 ABC transporter permease [Acidovorax sp. CCYZU-2555]